MLVYLSVAVSVLGGDNTAVLPAQAVAVDIKKFGAVGDGNTMDTAAIQKAIDAAAAVGGGRVLFPPGVYLSGSITLKSHVKLELDKSAVLLGSPCRADYRKVNFYGLILADNQEDIGISGGGVIDGQGKLLVADVEKQVKEGKLPDSSEAQRPVIVNFRNCRNVSVSGITLKESACWVQHYRDCEKLTVKNITVRTLATITNDGIDVDGCSDVLVQGCDIDSEDDGICLKSGRKVCQNVLVENCRVRSTCNALKFGTASTGGFKNITCRNLEIYDTYISAIALEIVDGGVMENVNISKVKITDTSNPLFIRLGKRNATGAAGKIRGITISDISAEIPDRPRKEMNKFPPNWRHRCVTLVTGSITGLPGSPVKDVTLRNVTITYGGIGPIPRDEHHRIDALAKVPECEERYPEATMFGVLPAWGFYCRHVEGITFENVTLKVKGRDYRPALVCDDAKNIVMKGFNVLSAGREPVIVLNNVRGAEIRDSNSPPGTAEFIRKMGDTKNVKGP